MFNFDQFIAPQQIINGTLYVLLVFSILTWTLILFKAWQFSKNNYYNKQFIKVFWKTTDLGAAKRLSSTAKGSIGRIAHEGFNWLTASLETTTNTIDFFGAPHDLLEQTLRIQMQKEQQTMEYGLTLLASIGSTSPFVGLFGTVLGIMHAMHEITASGSTSLDVVAGPIGDALVATAIGIAVAVPAVLAYNYFLRRAKQQRINLENFVNAFLPMAFSKKAQGGLKNEL